MKLRTRQADGYTLIEMMVVAAILLVVMGILLPMVGKARFKARCTGCTSNLQQFTAAMLHYATDNNGHLPQFGLGGTAGNAFDVSNEFSKLLTNKYNIPIDHLFCPLTDPDEARATYDANTTFRTIGYMVWIPRGNGVPPGPIPIVPPIKYGDAPYSYPSPQPAGAIAGPARIGDALGAKVPIITDSVATEATPVPPASARVNGGFPLVASTQHVWHGKVDQCNQGYADGHVEVVPADFLKPQYLSGGLWNWR